MDANLLTIMIAIIGATPGVIALIRQWRRDRTAAPLEDASKAVDTSASAAVALKSYSDEVIRLRGELAQMRMELTAVKTDMEIKDDLMDEWAAGIKRLIAQLVSMNAVPVWQPRQQKGGE